MCWEIDCLMLCVARALWLTSLIIHPSISQSPICCPTAAMSTAVALAVENARRRHLRMPAPTARLRTFKDLLRHIAEFAVANNLQSLDELFPGRDGDPDYYFSKCDVKHINELWQRLDDKSGNLMSEGSVCIYRNEEGGPCGFILWLHPGWPWCSDWYFDVTQSGEVVELTEA